MSVFNNAILNIRNPKGHTHRYCDEQVFLLYNQRDPNPREQEAFKLSARLVRFYADGKMTKTLKKSLAEAKSDEKMYQQIMDEDNLFNIFSVYDNPTMRDIKDTVDFCISSRNKAMLRDMRVYSIFLDYAAFVIHAILKQQKKNTQRVRRVRRDAPRLPHLN